MIEYVKGDLLKSDCDIILHGCNCMHTMGAGIAKQIAEVYPEAYEADKTQSIRGDRNKLGDFTLAKSVNPFIEKKNVVIVNCYTQYDYGRDRNKVYADYNAIKSVMEKIKITFPFGKIGMPKIGCNLANGDWNRVEHIINSIFRDRTVYVYDIEDKQFSFNFNRLKEVFKENNTD